MLAMKLVRLIEAHSEKLSRTLAQQIRNSDRTSDFRNIPAEDLRLAATEVYRNLGEWLMATGDFGAARSIRVGARAHSRSSLALPPPRSFRRQHCRTARRTRNAATPEPVLRPRSLLRRSRLRRGRTGYGERRTGTRQRPGSLHRPDGPAHLPGARTLKPKKD